MKTIIYKNSIETGLESETFSVNSCLAYYKNIYGNRNSDRFV